MAALGVASLAVAAWHEPGPVVLSQADLDYCPLPRKTPPLGQQARPDGDLLLFLFGLSQAKGPQG